MAKKVSAKLPKVAEDHKKLVSDLHNEIERKDDEIAAKDEIIEALHVGLEQAREAETEIAGLKTQMIAKEAQIQELKRYLEVTKAAMRPFIQCAKGEGTTLPEDWERLKELSFG